MISSHRCSPATSSQSTRTGSALKETVRYPGTNDVILGRGGESNSHMGNVKFRTLIEDWKPVYRSAPRIQKQQIARHIVLTWRQLDPPGRFLAKATNTTDKESDFYYDVGDEAAKKRTFKSLSERIKNPWAATPAIHSHEHSLTANGKSKSTPPVSPKAGTAGRALEANSKASETMQSSPSLLPPGHQGFLVPHLTTGALLSLTGKPAGTRAPPQQSKQTQYSKLPASKTTDTGTRTTKTEQSPSFLWDFTQDTSSAPTASAATCNSCNLVNERLSVLVAGQAGSAWLAETPRLPDESQKGIAALCSESASCSSQRKPAVDEETRTDIALPLLASVSSGSSSSVTLREDDNLEGNGCDILSLKEQLRRFSAAANIPTAAELIKGFP